MAWTEADRATIRSYLGFPALFLQADPRLEAAMTSVQSEADGGVRPDGSTESQIRGWLAQLVKVESRLEELWDEAEALKVDELGVDPLRAMALLRAEGRRIVGRIARALGTSPRHDVFTGADPRDPPVMRRTSGVLLRGRSSSRRPHISSSSTCFRGRSGSKEESRDRTRRTRKRRVVRSCLAEARRCPPGPSTTSRLQVGTAAARGLAWPHEPSSPAAGERYAAHA